MFHDFRKKYGKHLRCNYSSFKKLDEPTDGIDLDRSESIRSKVAMDFTGRVGRLVEDPAEARAIFHSEGNVWRERLWSRASRSKGGSVEAEMKREVHHNQPWFHNKINKELATDLLSIHGYVDGTFLVRSGRSKADGNVLSIKCQEKVFHFPITMVEDAVQKTMCYTIDKGVTKFYDICQLVEFYRLNIGPLPSRLVTHVEKFQCRPPGSSKT